MLESADYDNDGKVTIDDFMYLMKVGGLVWKLEIINVFNMISAIHVLLFLSLWNCVLLYI